MRATTSLGRPELTCGAPIVTTPGCGAAAPKRPSPPPMSKGSPAIIPPAPCPMLLGDASALESAAADGIGAGCADDPIASNEPNDSSALFFDGRIAGEGNAGGAAAGAAACGAARRSADGDSGSLSAKFADGPLAFSSNPLVPSSWASKGFAG